MTPAELDMITEALRFKADQLSRLAGSRKFYGEAFTEVRREYRLAAKKRRELAERIERAS